MLPSDKHRFFSMLRRKHNSALRSHMETLHELREQIRSGDNTTPSGYGFYLYDPIHHRGKWIEAWAHGLRATCRRWRRRRRRWWRRPHVYFQSTSECLYSSSLNAETFLPYPKRVSDWDRRPLKLPVVVLALPCRASSDEAPTTMEVSVYWRWGVIARCFSNEEKNYEPQWLAMIAAYIAWSKRAIWRIESEWLDLIRPAGS